MRSLYIYLYIYNRPLNTLYIHSLHCRVTSITGIIVTHQGFDDIFLFVDQFEGLKDFFAHILHLGAVAILSELHMAEFIGDLIEIVYDLIAFIFVHDTFLLQCLILDVLRSISYGVTDLSSRYSSAYTLRVSPPKAFMMRGRFSLMASKTIP